MVPGIPRNANKILPERKTANTNIMLETKKILEERFGDKIKSLGGGILSYRKKENGVKEFRYNDGTLVKITREMVKLVVLPNQTCVIISPQGAVTEFNEKKGLIKITFKDGSMEVLAKKGDNVSGYTPGLMTVKRESGGEAYDAEMERLRKMKVL